MAKQVILKEANVHPKTGYIEVELVTIDNSSGSIVEGHSSTYGCDAHVLQRSYNGDVHLWLAAMKGRHLEHIGAHEGIVDKLQQLQGKEI
jgi:non-canonical (house-cleaning) NTP pyrophosphatase